MSGKEKVCTISGLRPHKLPCELDLTLLQNKLEYEIRKSVFLGYTTFQTGMAMGVDIWAAEIILRMREKFPDMRLVCYLPCEAQADKWLVDWREEYIKILAKADEVICLQTNYTTGCMQRRNRKMIDNSSRLIAVHDLASSGGTAQTIYYARNQGLDIVIINPYDCV